MGCWEQMHVPVPLRGLISAPFRAFGVRPSRMNPNTCTICELMFTKVMRARKITIDATIMFADLRGYTSLSQSQSPDAVSGLLDAFYDMESHAPEISSHTFILSAFSLERMQSPFSSSRLSRKTSISSASLTA